MDFKKKLQYVMSEYETILSRQNEKSDKFFNGLIERYKYPILTAEHIPPFWKYDFNEKTNPYFIERLGVNAVLNPGAIELNGKILLVCRVEGVDRKSFFAVAQSDNGIDNFKFWDYPILMPQTDEPDTNVYDMRLVKHQDGWIYGLFCTERKDKTKNDTSSAVAQCGIARTKDLVTWERLKDLKSSSPQQRNVVLHPEFINGKYAFYTRPQDDFIEAGSGGGIGWGLADDIENAEIKDEKIIDSKIYHTIKEVKNGQGPAPIKTKLGWLHIAHGVRNTAAGLRYVLYAFLSDLNEPNKILYQPGGYILAPMGDERVGDVSNVVFCNGMVEKKDGQLLIYYASSDTRIHVASTTIEKMLDYVVNTPKDSLYTYNCVEDRIALISSNKNLII